MNQAQQMIATGAALLRTQSAQAEPMTFDGVVYWCNVNRLPASQEYGIDVGVSTLLGSTVEFPSGGNIPEKGDTLEDSFGHIHRVKSAKFISHAWKLECEVTS